MFFVSLLNAFSEYGLLKKKKKDTNTFCMDFLSVCYESGKDEQNKEILLS